MGYLLPYQFPVAAAKYISVAFLAGLDSVIGGTRAGLENKFRFGIFFSGFFVNLLLAAGITWVGDMLGVEIYQAAVVTFGVRVFINLGYIRRDLLNQNKDKEKSSLEFLTDNRKG
ncbi:small basic family protein [bacterium]|nr:small basic family protein [bacterium]